MAKDIFLTGIIDEFAAEMFRWEIENSIEKEINLYISSYGGIVDKGFQIANYIEAVNAGGTKKISTFNLAHADSIATVVFLAPPPEQRFVVESSTMFKHEPRFMFEMDITKDKAGKMGKKLDIDLNRIADYYTKKIPGMDKEEALQLMKDETTLTSDDIIMYGIAFEKLENFQIAAYKHFINEKEKQMGIFNKKTDPSKPTNIVDLADEKTKLLIAGELAVGAQALGITGVANEKLEGEYELKDGRKINIDKDSKVTEITEAGGDNTDEETDEILNAVGAMIAESEARIEAKFTEALRKVGSNHKPQPTRKPANAATITDVDDAQKAAGEALKQKIAEKVEAYRKSQTV